MHLGLERAHTPLQFEALLQHAPLGGRERLRTRDETAALLIEHLLDRSHGTDGQRRRFGRTGHGSPCGRERERDDEKEDRMALVHVSRQKW